MKDQNGTCREMDVGMCGDGGGGGVEIIACDEEKGGW